MTKKTASSPALVTPVVRALRLLRYIAEGGSTANTSEVGRLIQVNRVTVSRLLTTLEAEGLIQALPQGGHQVATGFLRLAANCLAEHDLLAAGRRVAAALSQQFSLSVYLVLPNQLDVMYVLRHMPEEGLVSRIRLGSQMPAYLTAPGRAMLATLSEASLKTLFANHRYQANLPSQPDNWRSLSEQISRDRQAQCVWSFSGLEEGINACGAAILDGQQRAVAGLSVVGPAYRFEKNKQLEQAVTEQVQQAADDLTQVALVDGVFRPSFSATSDVSGE
ncbi:MAG TPA: IclR family transcriptional regulator [Burkholderiaceae bacterium]|nr:IclR family transcriptional regulator [Burkholderiaceae bacterium]